MLEKIFGWSSVITWSCVPYPQIFTNLKNKNSDGMSVSMIFLSVLQFLCYTFLSYILFFSNNIKNKYQKIMKDDCTDIYLSDLFFGTHALLSTLILVFQYYYYDHSNNKLTIISSINLLTLTILVLLEITLCIILYYIHNNDIFLAYLILCFSISHNVFTFLKYVPQIYYTYKRKSIHDWNIANVHFDILGALFLLSEMIVTAINKNEIDSLFSNLAKFNLTIITILFDSILYIQYYYFYPHNLKTFTNFRENLIK